MSETMLQKAEALARRAHAGQVDKFGSPYILHVERVAAAVEGEREKAVAWLHDVLEDCQFYAPHVYDDFPGTIFRVVELLSRVGNGTDEAYYRAIRSNPTALAVKLADIADNMDEARLAKLDDKTAARLRRKYAKALEALA